MLAGYKTYIVGSLTILGAIGAYLTGDETISQAVEIIVPAILAMTIRHGIATNGAKP